MPDIIVFSEKNELVPELLGKAQALKDGLGAQAVTAVLLGGSGEDADSLARHGADHVLVSKADASSAPDAKSKASMLAAIAREKEAPLVLMASTRRGRETAGRLAHRLGGVCVTDINALDAADGKPVYERYNLGGNTVERASVDGPTPVFTSMPKSFEPAPEGSTSGDVQELSAEMDAPAFAVLEKKAKEGESVNLEDARAIVCVGKGFENKDNLGPAMELAKVLEGEVGCTREPATDFGWFSEERILGLSGKKASPELYVGVGISGQIQHTVGILGAKCIVVVNKDKDAPFFSMADYGVVADLAAFLPKFIEAMTS